MSVTTVLAVWACFWAIAFGFRESIIAMSESRFQFAVNVSRLGGRLFDALTPLSVLLVQAISFYRVTKLFQVVRSQLPAVEVVVGGDAGSSVSTL